MNRYKNGINSRTFSPYADMQDGLNNKVADNFLAA